MRFLKHNIRDDFDDLTDVAAFYRVKSVPSFLFLVGGAQVEPPPFAYRSLPPLDLGSSVHSQLPSPAVGVQAFWLRFTAGAHIHIRMPSAWHIEAHLLALSCTCTVSLCVRRCGA